MSEETLTRPRIGDLTMRQVWHRTRLVLIGTAVGVSGVFLAASIAAATTDDPTPATPTTVVNVDNARMCHGATDYNCLETEDEAGSRITAYRLVPRA